MEKVKINIVPKGLKPACYVSQNDNGRVVRFELFDELTPYTLDGSETITITVVRPDGVELVSSVVNTEDSYIDVVFNDDMTAIAGIADCELTITDGETVLGSRNFDMNIEIDAYNGKDVVIETETGTLLSFNTEVEDNALEYESEIPYNAEGYTGLRVINSRTTPVYNKTPYLFRKTPSGYGNSCIEKLTGLSVAFNQFSLKGVTTGSRNGIIYNRDAAGRYTVTGECDNSGGSWYSITNVTIIVGHAYYYAISGNTKVSIWQLGYLNQTEKTTAGIYKSVGTNAFGIYVHYGSGEVNETVTPMVIDLTQMFGSTIADYIYSLETAQDGAGVAYFKNLFGADYYPYNAGELMSVKTSGRKTIGFNQWDEEWEVGAIIASGAVDSGSATRRTTSFIRVLPNTTYYQASPSNAYSGRIAFYDKNQNCILYDYTGVSPINKTFTTTNDTAFVRITFGVNYGTTYNHDICINISDPDKDGTYEPYSEETYNLGGDELRGLLKLDANNNIFAYGDTKTSDGNIERKFGIVDLGSLNWNIYGGDKFYTTISDLKLPTTTDERATGMICPIFTPSSSLSVGEMDNYSFLRFNQSENFWVRDTAYSDAASFKAAMSGQYLIYELATPTTESSTPFDNPQEVKVTEEFIDGRAVEIPVGHDTIYGTDIEYQDIDFDTTIFGGNINAVDGVLSSEYNSDGSVKPTPEIIDITPTPIPVKAGDNNIFNSASGSQTIRYYNQED